MGLGRNWSKGHGNEFAILTEAFKRATPEKVDEFRRALEAGWPIMEARAILHDGVPLTRTSSGGNKLPDWDPAVTQFRWYHPNAHFWLPRMDEPSKSSRPYQIDLIMREALRVCCDLWLKYECHDIHFCGVCERPEFLIRYRRSADGRQARFWLEVPDHWASYDLSGRDGEERDMGSFFVPWGADQEPKGGVASSEEWGKELVEGEPFDPVAFTTAAGGVKYTLLRWDPEGTTDIVPQPGDGPPPSETRRLDTMRRLHASTTPALNERGGSAPVGVIELSPMPVEPPSTILHGSTAESAPTSNAADAAGGRYGRLFPSGLGPDGLNEQARKDELTLIADRMTAGDAELIDGNQYIDAIYTFFGQFVDHDITFDSASSLQRALDPDHLTDFRTPHLDLDSIYGGGPRQQPYLYDEHGRFVLGRDISSGDTYGVDLPRNDNGVALIVDPRNDQQAILSQLTVLFLRFHNSIIDRLEPGGSPQERFEKAQREVRFHYQWLVMWHFLPTVIGPHKAASYLWAAGAKPTGPELARELRDQLKLSIIRESGEVFIPVEFSAAAFRFGHSMVQSTYEVFPGSGRRGILDPGENGLVGRPVPVDWSYFVRGAGGGGRPQQSALINTTVIPGFARLPPGLVAQVGDDPVSLPRRTLRRGLLLHLPSGQTVASELRARGYRDVHALNPTEIGLDPMLASAETPLWYYILKEAELTRSGYRLGPLGATLVAEVLLGLLVHDTTSFLHDGWVPETGDFTFAHLVAQATAWMPDNSPPTTAAVAGSAGGTAG